MSLLLVLGLQLMDDVLTLAESRCLGDGYWEAPPQGLVQPTLSVGQVIATGEGKTSSRAGHRVSSTGGKGELALK